MKKLLFIVAFITIGLAAHAQIPGTTPTVKQTDTAKLYHPNADAKTDIANAVKQAAAQHKNVLLQIGGNWCIWCIRFNDLVVHDPELDKYVRANYVIVHVNYSKENENEALLAELGYPQRFGFPVFIILNGKGERLNTQNSEYLEDGKKSYNRQKVQSFLEMWSPGALNPKMYGD